MDSFHLKEIASFLVQFFIFGTGIFIVAITLIALFLAFMSLGF